MKNVSRKAPECSSNAPIIALPDNACDCHFHVFDELSTLVPSRMYTPNLSTVADYMALRKTLGVQRGVVVQPSVYGTDNRSTLAAVAQHPSMLRAIAVVKDSIGDSELEELHKQGVRGVRVNVTFGDSYDKQRILNLANRIKHYGWHIQLLVDVSEFDNIFEELANIAVPLVIDHMGHVSASKGINNVGFQRLLRSVSAGNTWVKLSAIYRMSTRSASPYNDVDPFARELLKANVERCLWATDWPHPGLTGGMPNDIELLDASSRWMTTAECRQLVFVDNPEQLYDFPKGQHE